MPYLPYENVTVVYVDYMTNCQERHVFGTTRIPPHDEQRCICGKVTWKDEVDREYKEYLLEHFA